MAERREADGRRARSKAPRAPWQRVARADGSWFYKKQITDPSTKRRRTVSGDTPEELLARCAKILEARRDIRAGLVSVEQAADRVAEATRRARGYSLREAWASHAKSATVSTQWGKKLRGMWACHFEGGPLANVCVHELTAEVVQGWLDVRPVSARMRKNLFVELRAVVARAIALRPGARWPWTPEDWRPALPREVATERAALGTREEEARFLLAAREVSRERAARLGRRDDLHHRVAVMTHLALRRGEAAALSWRDVQRLDGGDLLVTISRQAAEGWRRRVASMDDRGAPNDPTKGAGPHSDGVRRVRVTADGLVGRALRACLAMATDAGEAEAWRPVFPGPNGRHEARNVIAPALMRVIARRAGLDDGRRRWVQHSTRHSGATREAAEGAQLRDIQALTGHKSATVLLGYIHRVGAGLPVARADAALPELVEPPRSPDADLRAAALLGDSHEEQRERVNAAHARYLGREVRSLAQFLPADGQPLSREPPREVKREARKAYLRAYAKAGREGAARPEQLKAGAMARRAMLGAWGRVVAIEERRRRAGVGARLLESPSGVQGLEQLQHLAGDGVGSERGQHDLDGGSLERASGQGEAQCAEDGRGLGA